MATFLDITNRALAEVNEVLMTSGQFESPRGLQQFAKTAVNRAYFDITTESTEWPWLHNTVTRVEGTEILTAASGIQWYDLAATELDVDWHTFYITDKNPAVTDATLLPLVSKSLIYIDYDEWARSFRAYDNQRITETLGVPDYVIRNPNGKIGLSKVPDATYYLEYNVWRSATTFLLGSDAIPFPEEFETVLVSRILYYMWRAKDNAEQAELSLRDYNRQLKGMKRILLSTKSERMRAI